MSGQESGMTGMQVNQHFPFPVLKKFSQAERERFMANVMNLDPKIREEALFKAEQLDKEIEEIEKDSAGRKKFFFTDEMAANDFPDPLMADGGNSYEVEKNFCLAIRGRKREKKALEMKKILILSPERAVFCEFCGCRIDKERVKEVPHTTKCTDCKNKSHNGNGHNGHRN